MKAKILFFLGLIPFANNLAAQQADTAIARVFYQFIHVDDSTQREQAIKKEMILYLGKHGSLYRGAIEEESILARHLAEGGSESSFNSLDIIEKCPAQIHLGGYSYSLNRIFDSRYLITENLPEIDWQITEETREIGGFTVQKAVAQFRGREYTAWFTTELPFRYGPWKLHGLPGLILEAVDTKSDVSFKFAGFEIAKEEGALIAVPQSMEIQNVSRKEYTKMYRAFRTNPAAFFNATVGAQSGVSVKEEWGRDSKEYNNPLELVEN